MSYSVKGSFYSEKLTLMILSFRTDNSRQIVQIQIRLLLEEQSDQRRSSLIRVFTVCYSICIFWTNNPMVWPLYLNLKLITADFLRPKI